MIGSSLLRGRLLHCFSPRVLYVASNLLYRHNQYINNGYNQYRQQRAFSHSLKIGGSALSNASLPSRHFELVEGLLESPRQSINCMSFRSYGKQRFTQELALKLSESQIIHGVQTGRFNKDHVLLTFARKQILDDREFTPEFGREIGEMFVENYSSMKYFDRKAIWLLNALTNLKSPVNPSLIDLPVRLLQNGNGCKDKKMCNDLVQLIGQLPLLNWSSPLPENKLVLISQLVIPMIPKADNRYLTYLLHTWCRKDNQWKQVAREYLLTGEILKECQHRLVGIDVRQSMQLLEAVTICLPLLVPLPSGWLEDVQNWLLTQNIDGRRAATLLDVFEQIQRNCCPTQQHLGIPVAERMFKLWFNPQQKNIDRYCALLTCLVLRALGRLEIDPGDFDKRFWPWFWKNSESLNEWSDDQRVMVLDALYRLRITAAPKKWVQQIINTIRADNPMLSADLLYSLVRIREIVPDVEIQEKILRSLTKSYSHGIPSLSPMDLAVGAWSFAQLEFNPRRVAPHIYKEFYQHVCEHADAFTSHQQTMILTVVWKFHLEPPIEWMKLLLSSIDKTPPDSAHNAAHKLWYLKLLHEHFPHRTKNKQLLELLAAKEMLLKFYNHWANGLDSLERRELLFALKAIKYFGMDPTVGHPDIFEKWCKYMEKYVRNVSIAKKEKDLLLELASCRAYQDQLPNWFVELVKQNFKS